MFNARRPGKRSIVGTLVCAPYVDGLFWPGFIQSVDASGEVFCVQFNADGRSQVFTAADIVGPGFQTLQLVGDRLQVGQIVYVTHNGREVKGSLIESPEGLGPSDDEIDDVGVWVRIASSGDVVLRRKLDDIRLLESRKSARLVDHQDTDYTQLADLVSENKRRLQRNSRGRVHDDEEMQFEDSATDACSPRDGESELMAEHIAAMALTCLSCSPTSPTFPMPTRGELNSAGSSWESCGSSGVWSVQSPSSTPSPPGNTVLHAIPDDAADMDDCNNVEMSRTTVFQCTWPGCTERYHTCQGIEMHVRLAHLGPKDEDYYSDSDHEEEFYYTEMEVLVDTGERINSELRTSSTPQYSAPYHVPVQSRPPTDHDYQRKEYRSHPMNIPKSRYHHGATTIPTPARQSFSLSSNSQPIGDRQPMDDDEVQRPMSSSFDNFDASSSSPPGSPLKSVSSCKKLKAETKKCRKVYGIESRSIWCTQCKWKKACTRFHEANGKQIL